MVLGIVGGSSFLESACFSSFAAQTVETPAGSVCVHVNKSRSVVFVQRHGSDPTVAYRPPHAINFQAIAAALAQLGCRRVIGFGSVGSLHKSLATSSFVVPDDFFAPWDAVTAFDASKQGHLVPQLDRDLRASLVALVQEESAASGCPSRTEQAVYVQTKGPRFETPAEIAFFGTVGHVVGMTVASEASCLGERSIAYASVCMVDNFCNGVSDVEFSIDDFHAGLVRNRVAVERLVGRVLSHFAGADHPPAAAAAAAAAPAKAVDLAILARYVVPVNTATVLENHAVLVHEGEIVGISPIDALFEAWAPVRICDRSEHHVLLPGLINAHTHMGMTLFRGLADDLTLHDWLQNHIFPAEAKWVSPAFVRAGVRLAAAEMVRGGTTTVNDMYFYPESTSEVLDESGMRGLVGLPVFDFPMGYSPKGADSCFEHALACMKRFAGHARLDFAIAPHAPYTVADANLLRCAAFAEEHGVRLHTHLHETSEEVEDSIALNRASSSCHRSEHALSPVMNFARLGLLSDNLIAAHMTVLTDAEIAAVAESGTHVVTCSTSNLKLAAGMCRVGPLLQQSVNVAVGTDSAASNNALDMVAEMKLTSLLAKCGQRDPTAVPAYQAVRMATINGAKALGIDSKVGTIEVGKRADLITLDLEAIELVPVYDVLSHIAFAGDRHHVTDVWVDGKTLMRERNLLTIDKREVAREAHDWAVRIREGQQEETKQQPDSAAPAK